MKLLQTCGAPRYSFPSWHLRQTFPVYVPAAMAREPNLLVGLWGTTEGYAASEGEDHLPLNSSEGINPTSALG